MLKTGIILL